MLCLLGPYICYFSWFCLSEKIFSHFLFLSSPLYQLYLRHINSFYVFLVITTIYACVLKFIINSFQTIPFNGKIGFFLPLLCLICKVPPYLSCEIVKGKSELYSRAPLVFSQVWEVSSSWRPSGRVCRSTYGGPSELLLSLTT